MVEVILAFAFLALVVLWFGQEFFQAVLGDLYEHRREMKELDQDFERERLGGVGELFQKD